jgi:hypothetical protein
MLIVDNANWNPVPSQATDYAQPLIVATDDDSADGWVRQGDGWRSGSDLREGAHGLVIAPIASRNGT